MLRRRRSPGTQAAEVEDEEAREEAQEFQPLTGGLELIGQEILPVAEEGAEAQDDERKVLLAQEPTTPTRSSTGRPEAVSSAKASGAGNAGEPLEVSRATEPFETPNKRTSAPLFTPEQIRALEEVQSQAPAIYGGRQRKEDPAELRRPEFLKDEERRMKKPLTEASPKVKARLKPEVYKMDSQEEPEEDPREEELVWRFKVGRKLEEMDLRLRERDLENDFLREEFRRLKEAEGSTFNTPEEDGARARQASPEGIFKQKVHLRKLSWREHVMAGHTPFRKDCRVCQEACGKEGQHRRSKLPPKAGVLSIDVTGPFKRASDLVRGEAKYMLVGAFTWQSIRARPLQPEPVEEEEDDPRLEDERTEDEEHEELPAVEDPAEAPAVEEPAGGEDRPAVEEPAEEEARREEDEGAPEQVPMDVIRLQAANKEWCSQVSLPCTSNSVQMALKSASSIQIELGSFVRWVWRSGVLPDRCFRLGHQEISLNRMAGQSSQLEKSKVESGVF